MRRESVDEMGNVPIFDEGATLERAALRKSRAA
jgi:hypothetical protein